MSKERIAEALELSDEILKNFELSEIPTQNIILKCLRLSRLLNDIESLEWLKFEANGYERNSEGFLTKKSWQATAFLGRRYHEKIGEEVKEYAFTETIGVMEAVISASRQRMEVAKDPNISTASNSSFNPALPKGNSNERTSIINTINKYTEKIEKVRSKIYEHVVNVNYELKFGNLTENIFTRKRNDVDNKLSSMCPEAIRKFVSVYENLKSDNKEDWANAIHSCRRILKDVADVLYPPTDEKVLANGKTINVGKEKYINRLVLYVESKASSESYNSIVGSHLKYLGERLDSVYNATNKGTHAEVSLAESERYIIYTYLLIGDIVSL